MQMEIKFRAWDTNVKSMFSWKQMLLRWNSFSILTCPYLVPMQYTGLKDKNGKEIYDCDICMGTRGGSSYIFTVKWDEENARYLGHTTNGYICYVGQEPAVEVIGNIYQNPELLQGVSNE